jgi:hypothetical protein
VANASFNAAGEGGQEPIIPATSVYLERAVVRTEASEPAGRYMHFAFPGVSGGGTLFFKLAPAQIVWQLTLEAASFADLAAFEALVRGYRGAGRFTLQSEIADRSWDNVELRDYQAEDPPETLQPSAHLLRSARVLFEWMQPE